jgi:hypothetical protein
LVENVRADYVDELTETKVMLDTRYDDHRRVQPIDGEGTFARLIARPKRFR